MAVKTWVGKQIAKPQQITLQVTAVAASGTLTATINGKSITYTCTGSDTVNTAATNWHALLSASQEGEFAELTWTVATDTITAVGPDDGAPFTLSKSQAGSATCTLTTTVSPTSPHDFNDGLNWSDGSVPGNDDTAVWDVGSVDTLYNLSALSSTTFLITRKAGYTGVIGLPRTSSGGYVEYRARHIETAGLTIKLEQADSDGAAQIRIKCTSASASTVTITGNSSPRVGDEPFELTGLASTSTVSISGSGCSLSPLVGQTSTIATVRSVNGAVSLGSGVTLTTLNLVDSDAEVRCSYTTLTLDGSGTVRVLEAAAGTTTTLDAGTLEWVSTASFGTLTLGTDASLDLSEAPVSITPAAAIALHAGSSINDPAAKLAKTYSLSLVRCSLNEVELSLGTNFTLAVS